MLAFPMGNDQAIFEVCGALIARKSAIPFRDFLEMKQPLIFYIYSWSTILFGRHEYSIRILDVVYHIISLGLFYKIISKIYNNEFIGLLTIFIYTIYFLSGGYWSTAQTESFALLPQLGILYAVVGSFKATDKRKVIGYALLAGVCTILIISIKVTLGLIALPVIFSTVLFFRKLALRSSTFLVPYILSSIFFLSIEVYWLWASNALQNLILTFQWLANYASTFSPLFSTITFKDIYYKLVPEQFLVTFTLSLIALACYAVCTEKLRFITTKITTREFFRIFCLLCVGFGLVGILIERKAFTYHYTRITWCIVPFVAEGIFTLWNKRSTFSEWFSQWHGLQRFVLSVFFGLAVVVFFLWSPLPRIIDQSFGWSFIAINGDANARAKKIESSKYDLVDAISLAQHYAPSLTPTDHIFLWGNTVQLYYEFDQLPTTLCVANPQLISPWTPKVWIDTLVSQLKNAPPTYFLCELKDERPLITGTPDESYAALLKISPLREFLFSHYALVDSNAHFKMFKYIRS